MSEDDTTPALRSPEDAFSVLGDETRLSILFELARVASERGAEATVSFSALRDRVGVTDSGRFNYHLNQLSDGFVERVEDGYRARYPGLQVVSTVQAGLYAEPDRRTTEAAFDCPTCERPMEIAYRESVLVLRCPEHGPMTSYPVPPGALEGRTLQEAMTVAFRRAMAEMEFGMAGICQRCWGTVTVEWPVDPAQPGMAPADWLWTTVACDRCWLRYEVPYRTLVAAHPSVRGFYADSGHDQTAAIFSPVSTGNDSVCSVTVHDDRRVTVTVDLETTLSVTFDETFGVLDQRRTPPESG